MGLIDSNRTKSANIVGQTMKLNPHGDSAIYDTMARMSRGYGALPHPYVDSKGNFGKFYSRDMSKAASRYTEAKLENICKELFKDIEKDTVDFTFNYDNTMLEPTLLPSSYPSILVNSISGIAVGMASSICPFNLREICKTTINLIKNGLFKFPGANQVIASDGRKISLMNPKIREKICENLKVGETVLRHMKNGDILLVNRQPTLHKPSIMAHKAKILPKEKTFRLHYSNCSSYNADFDGD